MPFAGGQVFETGDEEFLKFASKKGQSHETSPMALA
jgi:hypothetical protein